ncbi:MAG: aminodeoxychorismate/anthranilate synthase component II [Crocinitomicaceae bacterium]|nr:aminodeoxychorismate/anthranilate synthase component II [Crocinitomicaceae bacterium]
MQRILLIDNYDSFTYNLAHYMEGEGVAVDIVLNDAFDCADLERYDKVVLSPGPGLPLDAGVLMDVVAACVGVRPVLGVCLGMQAIALHLGGSLYNQDVVKHGVAEFIELDSSSLFLGMSSPTQVGLYHSWAVESTGDFNVTARSKSGIVMALENTSKKLFGVQFHPESILTDDGRAVVRNFLAIQ